MKRKNPKLVFIQSIQQQARRMANEISVVTKSSIKTLQQRPKSYYTLQDVEEIVEKLKNQMLSINKETHTEFSKKGIKSLDLITSSSDSSLDLDDIVTKEELEEVKAEKVKLEAKIASLKSLQLKIDDFQILLDEKDAEISQLQSQSGVSSDKVQSQIEEMNKLQEQLDDSLRETKQAKQDREKMEAEFETVGNALMATRLEIEDLQTALGNKDIEIENLKSENQVLATHTEENIRLKEQNSRLLENIDTLRETVNKSEQEMKKYMAQNTSLKTRVTQLEQENEDLLLDSGETSQEAVELQEKLDEVQKSLIEREGEMKEISTRLTSEITSLKQEIAEKATRTQNLQNKLQETQTKMEELERANRALESQFEDLNIELKGKEKRIQSLEVDRNELRENFSNTKIDYEKQKSDIVDLKTQLGTKDRELNALQKDLDLMRQRHEVIAKQASDSRDVQADFERERELFEVKIHELTSEIEEISQLKDRLEKNLKKTKKDLKEREEDVDSLKMDHKRLIEKTENLMTAVETLRINLAKNPKYAILFVLQDIQSATVGELAKTVAIQLVFAARLMKELQSEGWVDFNEDTGMVRLKKPLLDFD